MQGAIVAYHNSAYCYELIYNHFLLEKKNKLGGLHVEFADIDNVGTSGNIQGFGFKPDSVGGKTQMYQAYKDFATNAAWTGLLMTGGKRLAALDLPAP